MSAPMDEQVERVAMAAAYSIRQPSDVSDNATEHWENIGTTAQYTWMVAIRAALAAMPSPDAAEVRNAALRELRDKWIVRDLTEADFTGAPPKAQTPPDGYDQFWSVLDQPAPAPVSVAEAAKVLIDRYDHDQKNGLTYGADEFLRLCRSCALAGDQP